MCVYAQLSKVGEALLRDLKAKKVEFQDRRLDLEMQDGIFVPIRYKSSRPTAPSPLFTRMNSRCLAMSSAKFCQTNMKFLKLTEAGFPGLIRRGARMTRQSQGVCLGVQIPVT